MSQLLLTTILSIAYCLSVFMFLYSYYPHRASFTRTETCAIYYFTLLFTTIPMAYFIVKAKLRFAGKCGSPASTFGYSVVDDGKRRFTGIYAFLFFLFATVFTTCMLVGLFSEINGIVLTSRTGISQEGTVVDILPYYSVQRDAYNAVVQLNNNGTTIRYTDQLTKKKQEIKLNETVMVRRSVIDREKYYIEPMNKYIHAYSVSVFIYMVYNNLIALLALACFYFSWLRYQKRFMTISSSPPLTPLPAKSD